MQSQHQGRTDNWLPKWTTQNPSSPFTWLQAPQYSGFCPFRFNSKSSLDALDLKEMREQAKAATEVEQEKQKARFDAKRSKPPQYAVGDIVVVATNPVATGQSNKLVAKSKGPFKDLRNVSLGRVMDQRRVTRTTASALALRIHDGNRAGLSENSEPLGQLDKAVDARSHLLPRQELLEPVSLLLTGGTLEVLGQSGMTSFRQVGGF
ncbi:hypothetical protein KQX54_005481 [Cotesia glomerata]|uniref:Uncharacterized protein n=1 Tax=Cotesia glomerata TaxID=32391 RepID=A0AAV7J0H2_COTGL|nr:hypothetical protein KQX54_005481 [Cotesia glomerata]